jgi:hypothetical protein
MKFCLAYISLLLLSSCFLMPLGAPHYHKYEAIVDEEIAVVNVFCTPKTKVFHFLYKENANIDVCSKVFIENKCETFNYDYFFDEEKYLKTIRINDHKFHKLFEEDTLKIKIDNVEKELQFLPVE